MLLQQEVLGKNHPNVANTLNNLGTLSFNQGKLDQAADYLQQALVILSKTFDQDHPDVKLYRDNLDHVRQRVGK